MKKKAAIVTIIITSAIIWVLTALAVGLNGTQSLAFTDVIQEAGSGVTYVKNSKSPVTFLPVGKECEFEITVDGPKEIVPTISISLDLLMRSPYSKSPLKTELSRPESLVSTTKRYF